MYAVIFEVKPTEAGRAEYLEFSANLRKLFENRPGFISIERFQSLVEENKVLSLSFWEDEASIEAWRNVVDHRTAQKSGKGALFESYRIRVAQWSGAIPTQTGTMPRQTQTRPSYKFMPCGPAVGQSPTQLKGTPGKIFRSVTLADTPPRYRGDTTLRVWGPCALFEKRDSPGFSRPKTIFRHLFG